MASPTDSKEKDVLPALDDDVEVVTTQDAPERDAEPDERPARKPADDDRAESPREAAVRRYRELRDQARTESPDDDAVDDEANGAADAVRDATPPTKAAPSVEVSQPAAQPSPANDTALDATRALLEQTKALLEEAKAARAPAVASNDDVDGTNDDATDGKSDEDKLEDIVERIQIGDKAEGRQALTELIEIMGGRGKAGSDDVGRVVQQQIAQNQVLGEISQATGAFREKYKSLVEDSDLLESSLRRLSVEIRDDLVKSGVKAEDIDRASPDQLMTMHQQARIRGQKVRGYNEIFEKVGADVSTKFGSIIGGSTKTAQPPAQVQTTTVADRVERKRTASAQPRAAGVRSTTGPQQKPKTRAEVVMEMRRQRGFKG